MESDLYSKLKKKFPENEYALMAEVRDQAGYNASRSADYIAVNLWPSRGLAINGIELKSHRGDWLSELKKPEKAEKIFQYCDYFWLLTSDDTIAKIEEIPTSWGWLAVKGEKIITKKEAPKLLPKEITKSFLCALLKRASNKKEFIHRDSIQQELEKVKESALNEKDFKHKRVLDELTTLNRIVRDFKDSSGIDLVAFQWDKQYPKRLGDAVKFLDSGGVENLQKQLIELEVKAKHIHEKILDGIEIFQIAN